MHKISAIGAITLFKFYKIHRNHDSRAAAVLQ
jgi:hypothetical protein